MLGPTSWLVATAFILALTLIVFSFLRTNQQRINALTLAFLPIFLVTAYLMLMGLAGWLRPLPLLLSSLIGLLIVALSKPARASLAQGLKGSLWTLGGVRAAWAEWPRWLRWCTSLAVAASALRFAFLIWALPPFVWDSLTYHLTSVAHWIQAGRIELFDTPIVRTFNPANYEVFATWFSVFLHHDVVIEAAGVPAYFLAILGIYASARGLGSSRAASWIGAMAYASTPALIIAATGTKNDPHMAAYFLASLALIIHFFRKAELGAARNIAGELTLLLLVLLLSFGTKTYIVNLLPGLGLIAAFGWIGSDRRRIQELLARVNPRGMARSYVLMLSLLLLAGLALAGYWNIRNWLVTGNPFYPYSVNLAGISVIQGPEVDFFLDPGQLAAGLRDFAHKFGDWRDPVRPDLPNTTGWGWFVYSLGLPSVAWALLRRPRYRRIIAGFVLSFLLILLSVGPSPWNMRFMLWFPALFALCFSAVVDAWPRSPMRLPAFALAALAIGSLGLNFASTLNYNKVSAEEFRTMLDLPVSGRHAALFEDNMPAAYANAIEYVPPGSILGYNVHQNGFVYPLYRADFSQRITFVPFSATDSCETIARAMEDRGTRYLLVAPEHTWDANLAALRSCASEESPIRERARGLYVIKR